MTNEYFPQDKTFWVCFDESNGHKESKRYLWWFDTKKKAKEHRKWHKKMDYAPLSQPIEVKKMRS